MFPHTFLTRQICNFTDLCSCPCQVWNSFFSLTVLYINQPSLQLEALGPAKRKKILDK